MKRAIFPNTGLAVARRAGLVSLAFLAIGCSSPPQQDSISDRQQAALKDPMAYKVPPNPDVTDGNTATFDKNGFQRDLNDAINP